MGGVDQVGRGEGGGGGKLKTKEMEHAHSVVPVSQMVLALYAPSHPRSYVYITL